MATGQVFPNDVTPTHTRPLRLVSVAEEAALPGGPPPLAASSPSPSLRRLQRELAAAHAEARSLRELLEELPAILERKFQQRLQALLVEQRQLEQENALLQGHLLALVNGGEPALAHPPLLEGSPHAACPSETPCAEDAPQGDSPITQGLGLRRALRRLHR
ncbi:MAG: hypothetical protein VKO39_12015 [Cyanobacteriota bacterium]|nr:hypothetical protein [Cyanobacteriota bacterium]